MVKKNIALIAGGFTGEYEVSVNSAKYIAENLDKTKYNVYTIFVTREKWFYQSGNEQIVVDRHDFTLNLEGKKIEFDFAFITVHGSPGEDGKLQGYFDMLGIPYNTCDATTSAITMNKAYTKAIVHGIHGLNTAKSLQLFKRDLHDVSTIAANLKFPLFIKPNNGGSSVGMSKVHNAAELPMALEKAFHEDSQVLVEEYIKGREFSVGIVRLKGHITVLPVTEIISSKEFFDYEAKYTSGVSREITPGDLTAAQRELVESVATEVYLRLNCRGMTRMDFIFEENTGNFYFIEINTTPGQTMNSLIPQQVRAAGMNITEFYDELIEGTM
ncbi:MAG TPA: D-alanine--D-alanine ligase [Mucilaginibacter sp.]|nr:D-alanine--D-alanine ligase [Mucilaginibacter sp.]